MTPFYPNFLWFPKPCPWCGKPIIRLGIRPSSTPVKWYTLKSVIVPRGRISPWSTWLKGYVVKRLAWACPHCGKAVVVSKKAFLWLLLCIPFPLYMAIQFLVITNSMDSIPGSSVLGNMNDVFPWLLVLMGAGFFLFNLTASLEKDDNG